jgi:hypothetical protein
MPFARIAAEWTHDDQSIPDSVNQTVSHRAEPPSVRGITLDTQWHKIDPNQYAYFFNNLEISHADIGPSIQPRPG